MRSTTEKQVEQINQERRTSLKNGSRIAMAASVESHLRELVEQGFEVTVVKDATAGPRIPEGDGYLAALTNFRLIANDLWTTAETVKKMGA